MTYFTKEKISPCDIAGAVAEAAVHDLRVNLFSFSGFPQIHVSDPIGEVFNVTLSWNSSSESKVSFELSVSEAITAAKKFKGGNGFDRAIFDRVQSSLAELERKSR
ncbi:MAG: hypothetical protein KKD44_07925 [Proteobacteria bacterium]|nr:hypothetical protein [Pseudomonadota bacterium]